MTSELSGVQFVPTSSDVGKHPYDTVSDIKSALNAMGEYVSGPLRGNAFCAYSPGVVSAVGAIQMKYSLSFC